jgi:uncharacterized flavoprotein (TIGR03862 family)
MNDATSRAAVIGGGPAGLMAAEVLSRGGVTTTVYDRMPSVGRKFLMAGRGGLNLTHSEPLAKFLSRYGTEAPRLGAAVEAFPPQTLREWSEGLDQPTFVGSSGRVFPKAFKASPLLRAWLRQLAGSGVAFKMRHRWTGWDGDGRLTFATPDGSVVVEADATVFALGGASWPKLGSDGSWTDIFAANGIAVAPLEPANAGVVVAWSDIFRRFEGQPLKRIAVSCGGHTARGEALVTRGGLEGGAIYALSKPMRTALAKDGAATLAIDLLPDLTTAALAQRLSAPRGKQSFSNALRKATRLAPVALGLTREGAAQSALKLAAMDRETLTAFIKAVPVKVTAMAPLASAISAAGGVRFDALDDHFMLKAKPGVFVAGEMLDWEAPTGGYLLQGCFATGVAAAQGALAWLETQNGLIGK